jgi:hypothetical protein
MTQRNYRLFQFFKFQKQNCNLKEKKEPILFKLISIIYILYGSNSVFFYDIVLTLQI